jgi:hypothetical protein
MELNERDLYFASKSIMALRPSIEEGWPHPYIFPILTFSEQDMKNAISIFAKRFNLTHGQLELLRFIQHVHRFHTRVMNYSKLWQNHGSLEGPLFVFIYMDDYEDQTNWDYMFLTKENVAKAPIDEVDRMRITEEMDRSSSERMKVNFLFTSKSERFPEQKFLMEVWSVLPTDENERFVTDTASTFNDLFVSCEQEPFNLNSHSEIIKKLVSIDRGDLLRVGLERQTVRRDLTPAQFDYNQFLVRISEMLRVSESEGTAAGLRADEENAVLAVFRMHDGEAGEPYQSTYGPIIRLTLPIAQEYLNQLENEELPENQEEQLLLEYEIKLYKRFIDVIHERNNTGMHYMFMHDEWTNTHDIPFFCLIEIDEEGDEDER